MKRIFVILLSIALGISTYAQMHRYSLDFTLSRHQFVDTIPIEFENDQIYLRAQIGNTFYRFNLDTGSSQGIAYSNGRMPLGRTLGLIESRDANNHIDTVTAVAFPTFRIGSLTVSGYSGSLMRGHLRHDEYDAIIGFDLFNKGLSAKIDAARGILILTDIKDFFASEEGYAMKYRLVRFVPHVRLSPWHDCYDEALFDTGSRRLYVMGNNSLQLFEEKFPDISCQIEGRSHGSRAIGSFGAERSERITFLWLDGFHFSGYHFFDYHTMTTQGFSRIGAEILRYGSIVINPRRKQLIFQPYDGGNMTYVSNTQTNIAFVPRSGGVFVGMVWEGSPHYLAGFRQGDQILKIDNRYINHFTDFMNYPFVEGRKHIFTVRSVNGVIHEVACER